MDSVFSARELRDLVARASTIDERTSGKYFATDIKPSKIAEQRFLRWCQSAAAGDRVLFESHVEASFHGVDSVLPLLDKVSLAENEPLPQWAATFSQAVDRMCAHDTLPIDLAGESVAFEDLLAPVVSVAADHPSNQEIDSDVVFSELANASLRRSLLADLSRLLTPTLYESFVAFRISRINELSSLAAVGGPADSCSEYDAFVQQMWVGGLKSYFLDRPVLARVLGLVVGQWLDVARELRGRLGKDYALLSRYFYSGRVIGPVTAITGPLSDRHLGGRGVYLLNFESGIRLGYKPKNLALATVWGAMLKRLEQLGAPVALRAPMVLDRGDYGWVEWCDPEECESEEEVRRFYRRAGGMLCLMHLLQGTDCHAGNVIAVRDNPMLVDVETLLHPRAPFLFSNAGAKAAVAAAAERLEDSVLATGYLPNWAVLGVGRVANVGGLNAAEYQERERWTIVDINTDAMRLERRLTPINTEQNLPKLSGQIVSLGGYEQNIAAGFDDMYRFALSNRGEVIDCVEAFRGAQMRVLLRPTRLYSLLLKRAMENSHLGNGVDWSLHFDFLLRLGRWLDPETHGASIMACERSALVSLDVPIFHARTEGLDLISEGGVVVPGFFDRASIDQVRERLECLSDDTRAAQGRLVRLALQGRLRVGREEPWVSGTGPTLVAEDAERQACAFAETLAASAIRAGGGAAWIGAVPHPGEVKDELQVLGYDMYSGTTGIAVFLSALWSISKQCSAYRELALSALAPLRQDLRSSGGADRLAREMGVGGASGMGSLIYAFVLAARFLDAEELLDDARMAAATITAPRIKSDDALDVMGGTAGAILGLLALHRESDDDGVLRQAVMCGRRLLGAQCACAGEGRAWDTIGRKPMCGASHGAAGITSALLRLFETSGEEKFRRAAQAGIAYERSVFSASMGNWPDFREFPRYAREPEWPCQWCHGATGVGLARLSVLRMIDDPDTRREISVAVRTTLRRDFGDSDHLCCGNFGRLELIFSAGQRFGDEELIAESLRRAKHMLTDGSGFLWRIGDDEDNPGLFTGISGVGYQLLRMAYPNRLPSLLMWE